MGSMAWTKPAVIVACVRDGNATEMGAHAQNHEPSGILNTVDIRFRMTEVDVVVFLRQFNLIIRTMTDEDGLSTPFDSGGFAQWDGAEIYFNGSFRQHISRSRHGVDKFEDKDTGGRGGDKFGSAEHHISEGTLGGIAGHKSMGMIMIVIVVFNGKGA